MLIPYGTDAPIYHYPIVTVGTIVINVLLYVPVFLADAPYERPSTVLAGDDSGDDWAEEHADADNTADPFGDEPWADGDRRRAEVARKYEENLRKEKSESRTTDGSVRWLALELGRFNPQQWLTASYMHIGFMHLFGNMLFLWTFGLIVEGKIGWWKFLLAYNAIGVIGYGLTQLVLLGADGGIAIGASLPIFGLIAMALIWAPANELHCVLLLAFRVITFEASVATMAGVGIAWEAFKSGLRVISAHENEFGAVLTSETLHLTGAVVGAAIGFGMLFRNLVDCEGWDAISVWKGTHLKTIQDDREDVQRELERIKQMERSQHGPIAPVVFAGGTDAAAAEMRALIPTGLPAANSPMGEVLTRKFREFVKAGNSEQAREYWRRGIEQFPNWVLPEADHVELLSLLRSQKKWRSAVDAMRDYLLRYSERETTIRLALAQILIQHLDQPGEAREYLEAINVALLDAQQKANLSQIRQLLNSKGMGQF